MSDFHRNGQGDGVDREYVAWLRRLADAARAASDDLRALNDSILHGALLKDLDALQQAVAAELETALEPTSHVNADMDQRGRRIGENEIVFREVNERLRELGEGFSLVSELAEFVCECGDTSCTDRIQMPLAEYEHVRSDGKWFVVAKGHEAPEYERVISEHDGYAIVEKRPGGPAGLALRDDPRRDERQRTE